MFAPAFGFYPWIVKASINRYWFGQIPGRRQENVIHYIEYKEPFSQN